MDCGDRDIPCGVVVYCGRPFIIIVVGIECGKGDECCDMGGVGG